MLAIKKKIVIRSSDIFSSKMWYNLAIVREKVKIVT